MAMLLGLTLSVLAYISPLSAIGCCDDEDCCDGDKRTSIDIYTRSSLPFFDMHIGNRDFSTTQAYRFLKKIYLCIRSLSEKEVFPELFERSVYELPRRGMRERKNFSNESVRKRIWKMLYRCRNIVPPRIFREYNKALSRNDSLKCFKLLSSLFCGENKECKILEFLISKNTKFLTRCDPTCIAFFDIDKCGLPCSKFWVITVDPECERHGDCDVSYGIFLPKSVLSFKEHLKTSLCLDGEILRYMGELDGFRFSDMYNRHLKEFMKGLKRMSDYHKRIMMIKLKYFSFSAIAALISIINRDCRIDNNVCKAIHCIFDKRYRSFFDGLCRGFGILSK